MLLGDKSPKALAARWLLRDGGTLVATFQFAKANGQAYLPSTVGARKGEAGVQILHFLPTPQAPPGLRRAQRHFVEKRFDGAAKRSVDFELVRDRHLRNSAVSVTNMIRCSLLRLAGRRGAHCAKVRQQGIACGAISESERTYEERTKALQRRRKGGHFEATPFGRSASLGSV
jgi:hypothetical protein